MRSVPHLLVFLATACGVDHSSSTPVTIETTWTPALVAFRDGADGPWQTLAGKTPSTFELDANGPYMLTVVCDDGAGNVTTSQFARTLDDDHAIDASCAPASTSGTASGHMVQAGQVALGYSASFSSTPNWDFNLDSGTGTFDLVATSTDHIAVRRAVAISGDTMLVPAIDVAAGSQLVAAAPVVRNMLAGETVHTSVYLATKTTFANIYSGAAADLKIAPDDVMFVSDDQTVNVAADTATGFRALDREQFRPGDSTAFTLPEAIGPTQFPVTNNQLAATWSTLPDHDSLDAWVYWESSDFSKFSYHDIEISAAFVTATGVTSAPFDVAIPGYKPEWKLDVTQEYNVGLSALRKTGKDIVISGEQRDVNAPPRLTHIAAHRPLRRR